MMMLSQVKLFSLQNRQLEWLEGRKNGRKDGKKEEMKKRWKKGREGGRRDEGKKE